MRQDRPALGTLFYLPTFVSFENIQKIDCRIDSTFKNIANWAGMSQSKCH